ncbi:FkbM family methyltransferase [Flavihumibacter rivuli]|uniref:FkbM family methyltransferase n=1 Tax=Flavihumibacter rivuli TaxID=2838156 RepID=UPI001BDE1ED3|nr:FkbM family methyltransferase [Flavihumibacter rivuli]ULQ56252.1 FkbM family methyltransferase [Flavihumibacter rivuli]
MSIISRLKNLLTKDTIQIEELKKSFVPYLPANPSILEAGACDGNDTQELARLWPKGKVYSFEPVPEMYKKAAERNRQEKNVKLYPFALNDSTGKVTINISSGRSNASSSILKPKGHLDVHPDVLFSESIDVPSFTIDDWACNEGVTHIDLMWLDMQGAEYKVLKAAPRILQTVKLIYSEVSLIETYEGVVLYPQYRDWLAMQGFKVIREDLPYEDMGNVLFGRV